MKQIYYSILLTLLLSLFGVKTYAYDIAVDNADGVKIYYNFINDGEELEVTRNYYVNYQDSIYIPSEVVYGDVKRNVTRIGEEAFRNCTDLKYVSIPNNVNSIEFQAFKDCINLTSVKLPDNLINISYGAFQNCMSLTTVTIPDNVHSIGGYAFAYCNNLTTITIPNGVSIIDRAAFAHCVSLTSITIPNSVTILGENVFNGCCSLTSVIIPDKVTNIQYGLFEGCTSLISVTIPYGVTNIGICAFNNCYSLSSIDIPNSLTKIDNCAFCYCKSLTTITIPNSILSIGERAFDGVNFSTVVSKIENPFFIYGKNYDKSIFTESTFKNATLYVPVGTIDKYKLTSGWNDFENIEEGTGTGISRVELRGVSVENEGNVLSVFGVPEGAEIIVFNLAGQKVGSAKASFNKTIIPTLLNNGEIGIVKIGDMSMKVIIK